MLHITTKNLWFSRAEKEQYYGQENQILVHAARSSDPNTSMAKVLNGACESKVS